MDPRRWCGMRRRHPFVEARPLLLALVLVFLIILKVVI